VEKIRYAIVGTGWRAMFFVRAAKNLPELFEVTGILTRTKERAQAFEKEHGVKAFTDMDEMLRTKPEFVVSCVTKSAIEQTTLALIERGMNVLSETPIATDEEGLVRVYEAVRRRGVTLQLAEQYFLYPSHAARAALVKKGLLGRVCNCWLSLIHDYHALSMMRVYLGADDREAVIRAMSDRRDIVVTGDRSGVLTDGAIGYEERVAADVLEMRYVSLVPVAVVADSLGVSPSTVRRRGDYGIDWLSAHGLAHAKAGVGVAEG